VQSQLRNRGARTCNDDPRCTGAHHLSSSPPNHHHRQDICPSKFRHPPTPNTPIAHPQILLINPLHAPQNGTTPFKPPYINLSNVPTDRPLQLPIPPRRNPPHNLHIHIRALPIPGYDRPQQGQLLCLALLEGRTGGRAYESVREHCVRRHGGE
jgi:hypothetical protein